MLKHLFISKIRIKVLGKYMEDITKSYHVRGLVRELDEEVNAIRRELLNLKRAGILVTRKEGNKIMYSVDKSCPIIWDLRSMFYKRSKVGKLLLERLEPVEGVKVGIVTEAFLKKKYEEPTDIDMLFIGNMKVRELSSVLSSIEKDLNRPIKYVAIKPEDFKFGKKKRDPILINALIKDKIIVLGKDSDLL
ncbi:helix-turn-helix transcriptional regulator [Candidatus Dojkabacteria bacterium]|uniref:Helix-turn-helix transcriptional regulator n=1 Tax=Candidatus Dojkabacteria bacterium TaxID=2099670 RepID=A0A847VCQ1_9BACT|nr:helix-turn-helix transcriptional regulator [Candidatus Dojkabacteria bacterium]